MSESQKKLLKEHPRQVLLKNGYIMIDDSEGWEVYADTVGGGHDILYSKTEDGGALYVFRGLNKRLFPIYGLDMAISVSRFG